MEVTVAKRQGSGREAVAERSLRQISDRRKTNWQRGRACATSVQANAKSEIHQDTSGKARRHGETVETLTRGDLSREDEAEVSRGRSSDEARGNAGGAKGQRNRGPSSMEHCAAGQTPSGRQQTEVTPSRTLREPEWPKRCSRCKPQGEDTREHA
jgi:hypothetical protein